MMNLASLRCSEAKPSSRLEIPIFLSVAECSVRPDSFRNISRLCLALQDREAQHLQGIEAEPQRVVQRFPGGALQTPHLRRILVFLKNRNYL